MGFVGAAWFVCGVQVRERGCAGGAGREGALPAGVRRGVHGAHGGCECGGMWDV